MVRPPFPMLDRCAVGCVINVVVAAAVVADFVDAVAAGIDFADAMIPINETRTLVHSPITPFSSSMKQEPWFILPLLRSLGWPTRGFSILHLTKLISILHHTTLSYHSASSFTVKVS